MLLLPSAKCVHGNVYQYKEAWSQFLEPLFLSPIITTFYPLFCESTYEQTRTCVGGRSGGMAPNNSYDRALYREREGGGTDWPLRNYRARCSRDRENSSRDSEGMWNPARYSPIHHTHTEPCLLALTTHTQPTRAPRTHHHHHFDVVDEDDDDQV